MRTLAEIGILALAINGLRTVIGIPPLLKIGRVKSCPICDGEGWVSKT